MSILVAKGNWTCEVTNSTKSKILELLLINSTGNADESEIILFEIVYFSILNMERKEWFISIEKYDDE